MNADKALKQLKDGNLRYIEAEINGEKIDRTVVQHEVLLTQKPSAIILGCSDSRVPAEAVFDQGVGDLFIVRIAGNIVAPSQIGSIEFACQQFGTQLIVVLGHTGCGAISATIGSLLGDPGEISPNLAAIVDRISPAVQPIISTVDGDDREDILNKAIRANINYSAQQLESGSEILRDLVKQKKLTIVGAEYSIESGRVEFLD